MCPSYTIDKFTISDLGKLDLKINGNYGLNFTESDFNSSYVNMYVDPVYERDLRTSAWFTQDVASGSFDFNWTVNDYSIRNPFV